MQGEKEEGKHRDWPEKKRNSKIKGFDKSR